MMTVHEVSKLLFRELEFPLKDIKAIINSPDFDRSKLDEYSRQAKELYGSTPEYKEMEEKQKNRTEEDERFQNRKLYQVANNRNYYYLLDNRVKESSKKNTGLYYRKLIYLHK